MLSIVSRPAQQPGQCILSLRSEDPLGFVDFGITPAVVDPRVYGSVTYLKEIARDLGMVDASVVAGLEAKITDLEAQMAEYDRELDAISVLKGRGYVPTKKPGRPPLKAA